MNKTAWLVERSLHSSEPVLQQYAKYWQNKKQPGNTSPLRIDGWLKKALLHLTS